MFPKLDFRVRGKTRPTCDPSLSEVKNQGENPRKENKMRFQIKWIKSIGKTGTKSDDLKENLDFLKSRPESSGASWGCQTGAL